MVVELKSAPVTSPAVFGVIMYVSVTKLTVVFVFFFGEILFGKSAVPFLSYHCVTRVSYSGLVSQHYNSDIYQ